MNAGALATVNSTGPGFVECSEPVNFMCTPSSRSATLPAASDARFRKAGVRLETPSGGIMGERSMWADRAEMLTLENTREVCPGVYVAGMSANAAFGGPRMGPVFGGMILSGRKVAGLILERR